MALRVDRDRCTGCPAASEPPCGRVCPGDLLVREEGKVTLREAGECWGCAACLKVCPRGALALELPLELGGRGSRLTAWTTDGRTRWFLWRPNGRGDGFET